MQARWWQPEYAEGGILAAARCGLCPHNCRIAVGNSGLCDVRSCDADGLASPYLGLFSSLAVDPIEKKPLYHWRPGSRILSLGSVGCIMRCQFCQNHHIAHPSGEVRLTPLNIPGLAARTAQTGLRAVAYTYNEPALQAEYILEAAPVLQEKGIATVLVTNGMFSEALLADLSPWVAAANVDVKTFNPRTYARLGGSLDAVKRTVEGLHKAGSHVEVTTLVVPGISDSENDLVAMAEWLAAISPEIPLHLSRYFPAHAFTAPATDVRLLRRLASLAQERLQNVHLGNVR